LSWATFGSLDQESDRKQAIAKATPTFSWQNPVTQITVNVSGRWTFTTQSNEQGQTILTFSEPSNHAVVLLAEEVVHRASIHTYVTAFVEATHNRMAFDDGGASTTYGGLPAWVLTGHMVEDTSNRLRIEVVQQGDRYWRMVTIQSPPYDYTKAPAAELRQALRSSIAPASGSGT